MSSSERIAFDPQWMNAEGFMTGPLTLFKPFMEKVTSGANRTLVGEYPYYLDQDTVPLPGTHDHWVTIANRSASKIRSMPFSIYVGRHGITVKQAGYYYFENNAKSEIREPNMLDATYYITPHVISVRLGKYQSSNSTPDEGNMVQRWVFKYNRAGVGNWVKDCEIHLSKQPYDYTDESCIRNELFPFIEQYIASLKKRAVMQDIEHWFDRTKDYLDVVPIVTSATDTVPNRIIVEIHKSIIGYGHSQLKLPKEFLQLYWELCEQKPRSMFMGAVRDYMYQLCDMLTPLIEEHYQGVTD